MRIQPLSDLHLEFHADSGRAFIDSLNVSDVEVLVLAGDISTYSRGLYEQLAGFCDRFAHVIYVTGNHEYYGVDRTLLHTDSGHWPESNQTYSG
jgi:predicted phosphodiesterase